MKQIRYPNRSASFSVDHLEPKSVNPARTQDYENLVYACTRCNALRGTKLGFLDPTLASMADHLYVHDDGTIEGLSPAGRKMVELLDLAEGPALQVRKEMFLLLRAKRDRPNDPVIHQLYLSRFGFPSDLEDLSKLEPPGNNSRPQGIEASHFALKSRGDLPDVY
jgi:hypothetical protein